MTAGYFLHVNSAGFLESLCIHCSDASDIEFLPRTDFCRQMVPLVVRQAMAEEEYNTMLNRGGKGKILIRFNF